MLSDIPPEVTYICLLFGLFVVPKILQRWRIPAAIASLALGALAGPGLGLFQEDSTVRLLATFGIVALFLFAGLEVRAKDLRREARVIGEHLVVQMAALAAGGLVISAAMGLEGRISILVALAVLTPSTGFILDSLPSLGLTPETAFWVRTKAIAMEFVALGAMFFTLQSVSAEGLALSTIALLLMIVILPLLFRAFAHFIVPHAPKTEFAFLLMTALACALVSKKLGVYYLVGAFIVGMVAQRFRERLPGIASEKMLDAVEAFASIFVPFYFFYAGLVLQREDFTFGSLLFGGLLLIVGLPLRVALVAWHRKLRLGESFRETLRVGVPMIPTLIFTLVITHILREDFDVPHYLVGGLTIYALVNTMIPSLVFRMPTPEFETPEAPPLDRNSTRNASPPSAERK